MMKRIPSINVIGRKVVLKYFDNIKSVVQRAIIIRMNTMKTLDAKSM